MTGLFPAFAVIALLVATLYGIGLAGMASVWLRWTGLAVTAVAISLTYLAGVETLGRVKPVRLALLEPDTAEARLVASHAVEGVAIYLWLIPGGDGGEDGDAPRAYELPWSREMAEALRAAEAEAEARGGQVIVARPFDSNIPAEGRFTVPPPPPLPPKRPG